MTDCGCQKAKAELEEYLHNELARDDARDIREHMEGCTDCSSELHVNVVMTEAVQRASRFVPTKASNYDGIEAAGKSAGLIK